MGRKAPSRPKSLMTLMTHDTHDHLVAAWVLPPCSTFQL